RAAVRAALRWEDGMGGGSERIHRAVIQATGQGLDALISEVCTRPAERDRLTALAPAITALAAEDPEARKIALRAAEHLADQADAIAGRPMRAGTVFDLASLTKVVATTTVTLALAGRGELALGDPVAGYLPDAAACRDGGVTIAHLLTHTAGLPGSRRFYRWCRSRADLLRDLGHTPLGQPPGTGVAYSDPGFIL